MSKEQNRWIKVSKYFALLFAGSAVVAAVIPQFRETLQNAIISDYRTVLSTASGDVLGSGLVEKIVKVKTKEGLFLEIYSNHTNLNLVERILLDHRQDGYFMFNGEASNLVLDDVDGDSAVEILVPTFDQNLVAHLNIYSFNRSRNAFVKLN